MSGWGCPHELRGECQRVPRRACDPGMKGCILFGRFTFSTDTKNRPPKQPRRPAGSAAARPCGGKP